MNTNRSLWQVAGLDDPHLRVCAVLKGVAVVALFAATILTSGCGGGVESIGNPYGPWPVVVRVNVDVPRTPEGEEPGMYRVTWVIDGGEEETILRVRSGSPDCNVSNTREVRPGSHSVVVRMYDPGDVMVGEKVESFHVSNQAVFTPSNRITVDIAVSRQQ